MSKKDKNTNHPIFKAQNDPRAYDVYFDLAKSKDNWRKAFFIAAFTLVLVAGAFIFRSFQAKFQPFIVKVNEMGKAVAFGPAEPLKRTDERLLRAELHEWIKDIRSIYGSTELLNRQMNNAFALVSADVSKQLNQYFSIPEHDPRNLSKRWRRSVDVRSIIAVDRGDSRWQIKWVETLLSIDGRPYRRQAWEAFITIETHPPTSSDMILKNPLGIYITELNWGTISQPQSNL